MGLLEVLPQRMNHRPPPFHGRDHLETLLASESAADWLEISRMLLGPPPPGGWAGWQLPGSWEGGGADLRPLLPAPACGCRRRVDAGADHVGGWAGGRGARACWDQGVRAGLAQHADVLAETSPPARPPAQHRGCRCCAAGYTFAPKHKTNAYSASSASALGLAAADAPAAPAAAAGRDDWG